MASTYAFLIGAIFGSFANVFFYRFTRGLSVVHPRSSCPKCETPIAWYDNVPILSYLWLRGRCRRCRGTISWRYPAIESLCGALFLTIHSALEAYPPLVQAAFACFYFILFLAGGTDLETYFENNMEYGIIPDSLMILAAVAGVSFSFINPFLEDGLRDAAIGGATGSASLLAIRWAGEKIFNKEAMGLGDVKLIGAVGLWLGWRGVFSTIFCASLAGTVVCLALLGLKKLRRDSAVPFGPFLAAGSLSALFL